MSWPYCWVSASMTTFFTSKWGRVKEKQLSWCIWCVKTCLYQKLKKKRRCSLVNRVMTSTQSYLNLLSMGKELPGDAVHQSKGKHIGVNLKLVKIRVGVFFSFSSCLLLLIFLFHFVYLLAKFCWFSFHLFSLFYLEVQIVCSGQLILKSCYMFTLIIIWLSLFPSNFFF